MCVCVWNERMGCSCQASNNRANASGGVVQLCIRSRWAHWFRAKRPSQTSPSAYKHMRHPVPNQALISPMQLQLVRVHFQEGGGRGNEVSANATPIDGPQPPHPQCSRGKSVHYCITEGGNASVEVSRERVHEYDNGVMQGEREKGER